MLVQRWMPALLTLLVVDVGVLVAAAAAGRVHLIAFGAACFAAAFAGVAMAVNRRLWSSEAATQGGAIAALQANARLGALAWAWGGVAMQGVYLTPVTGLRWQHAWQYALAMLLVAWACAVFARWLEPRGPQADARRLRLVGLSPVLASLQAIGGAVGALFLVASGKLITWRPDWAANQIFLFGALLIMVLGGITLRTHRRLWRHVTATDASA